MTTVSSPFASRLPGEEAVWIFVLLDMMSFALFFAAFAGYRAFDPDMYAQSQQALHPEIGLLNTLFLICASWLVAVAVTRTRSGHHRHGTLCLHGAILFSLAFVALKGVEYTQLIQHGLIISTNEFFMFYYCLTLVHLLHTVIGIGVLIVIARATAKGRYALSQTGLESGASYWHMVDLIWIFLFPMLYLL